MQTARLQALLDKYKRITEPLTSVSDALPVLPVTIPLIPGARVPNVPMYRYTHVEKQALEDMVHDLLAKGMIQPSTSGFASPVLLVPKPDGTLRYVCDYRRTVNANSIPQRAEMPLLQDTLDALQGATIFTTLDLASGYFQLRLNPADIPKTAIRTPLGLYEWKVLPMGLTNAPAAFQRVMNNLFRPYIGRFVQVWLDDLIIYSRSPAEHLQHLETVFQVLQKADLRIKMSKCQFNKPELRYLGLVVGRSGLKTDERKVTAVRNYPAPTTVTELRSFLGMANYFRRFIQGYSSMTACLNTLTGNAKKHAKLQGMHVDT